MVIKQAQAADDTQENKSSTTKSTDEHGKTTTTQSSTSSFYGLDANEAFRVLNNGSFLTLIILCLMGWYVSKIFERYINTLITALNQSVERTDDLIDLMEKHIQDEEREFGELKTTKNKVDDILFEIKTLKADRK